MWVFLSVHTNRKKHSNGPLSSLCGWDKKQTRPKKKFDDFNLSFALLILFLKESNPSNVEIKSKTRNEVSPEEKQKQEKEK